MTTLQAKLKELRELAERATPGIWSVEDYRGNGNPDWRSTGLIWAKTEEQYYQPGTRVCAVNCDKLSSISPPEEIARFEADAAFIAASRTAIPQLVAALEKALEEELDYRKRVWQSEWTACQEQLAEAQKAHEADAVLTGRRAMELAGEIHAAREEAQRLREALEKIAFGSVTYKIEGGFNQRNRTREEMESVARAALSQPEKPAPSGEEKR